MPTDETNLHVGSIINGGEITFVIYQKEEDKNIDFYNGIQYSNHLMEGPKVGKLMEYYDERLNISIQKELSHFELFIQSAIEHILDDLNHMKVTYIESTTAFYEATGILRFIQALDNNLEKPKKYIKKCNQL